MNGQQGYENGGGQQGGGDAIPEGYYKGRAIPGSEQYSNKKGTDQIGVDFDVPEIGRTLTVIFYFSENAAEWAVKKLRKCGWQGSDPLNLAGIDANEVDISVSYEMYNNQRKMKVDVAGGGGRITLESPMDPQAKRAFGARMRSVIAGLEGGGTRLPPQQQRQAAPPRQQGYQQQPAMQRQQAPQQQHPSQVFASGQDQGGYGPPQDDIPF